MSSRPNCKVCFSARDNILLAGRDIICLFAKPPVAGRTKRRLAAGIGDAAAADLSRAMLQDMCDCILDVDNAEPQLWTVPDAVPEDFNDGLVPDRFTFQRQHGNDLGERMAFTMESQLSTGKGQDRSRVLIIGSDCVSHSGESLAAAFDQLADEEIVIQPAADGGYTLVGQSRYCPEMFSDVDWGTESVMDTTRLRLADAGRSWSELPQSFDIDDVSDLDILRRFLSEHCRPRTSAWLAAFDDGQCPVT